MSDLTQAPSIHVVYTLPATAAATSPISLSSSTNSTPPLSPNPAPAIFHHCHQLAPLPAHFTFPASGSYNDSTLLRCEWAELGYRMNVPQLTDLTVLVDVAGTSSALVEAVAASGYLVVDESGGCAVGHSRLLQLSCHRVVLSTASHVLRTIIHDGSVCDAPSTYAASSLLFRNCPLVPLLWLLHYLYSATVVASISLDDLVPTMQLARHFQVLPLLAACEQRATELLTTASLHALWSAATAVYEGLVVNACTDFIVANMRHILLSSHFTELPAFLRECIGGLLHDSQNVTANESERQELSQIYKARQEPSKEVQADEGDLKAAIDSSSAYSLSAFDVDTATLTQLIRKQKAQPHFDTLTSLCSLFFSPPSPGSASSATRQAAGKQTDSANNIAASFGRPPSLAVPADYSSDSSSDSDWDSDDEEEEQGTRHKPAPPASAPSASSRVSRANSLLTPPSPLGATSPRYRLQGKLESAAAFDWTATSKLLDGLPELTIDTASRPPRHPAPRHTRDRSCPLRQEEYVSLMAQHVQLPPATGIRARRPSAPAIY